MPAGPFLCRRGLDAGRGNAPGAHRDLDGRRPVGLGPSANVGKADNVLNGVSCATTTTCVAVGFDGAPGATQSLVEALSGTTWVALAGPKKATVTTCSTASATTSSTPCRAPRPSAWRWAITTTPRMYPRPSSPSPRARLVVWETSPRKRSVRRVGRSPRAPTPAPAAASLTAFPVPPRQIAWP